MRFTFKTLRQYILARDSNLARWDRFDMSPGGAARTLGVSRQRIHQLTHTDVLDAMIAKDGYALVDGAQVQRYRLTRLSRARTVG